MSVHVDVAVCTCRRPALIVQTLQSLLRQNVSPELIKSWRIIVVDNDYRQSGRDPVLSVAHDAPVPVIYSCEPKPGIPFARNHALNRMDPAADYFCFLDDDEVADPFWLQRLVEAVIKYRCDVIQGVVLPVYPDNTPSWVDQGRFFRRPIYESGFTLRGAATNNVLISRHIAQNYRFDEFMHSNGGDDSNFFYRVNRDAYVIKFASDAIIHELVPHDRMTIQWLSMRMFRVGSVGSEELVRRKPRFSALVVRFLKALYQYPKAVFFLFCSPFGYHYFVKAAQKVGLGTGMISGLFGLVYQEYQKVHESV